MLFSNEEVYYITKKKEVRKTNNLFYDAVLCVCTEYVRCNVASNTFVRLRVHFVGVRCALSACVRVFECGRKNQEKREL